jgi:hypothetical protein
MCLLSFVGAAEGAAGTAIYIENRRPDGTSSASWWLMLNTIPQKEPELIVLASGLVTKGPEIAE